MPKCKMFLESVAPYLIVKKSQAVLLMDYINKNPFIRGSKKLSDEVMNSRQRIYISMKMLNDYREKKASIVIKKRRNNAIILG